MQNIQDFPNGVSLPYGNDKYINVDQDGVNKVTGKINEEPDCEDTCEHALRYYVRAKLREFFVNDNDCNNLEIALFNSTLDDCNNSKTPMNWKDRLFKRKYKQKFVSLYYNMTNPKNEDLLDRIATGQVPITKLPYMTPYELDPKNWESTFLRIATAKMDMGDFAVQMEEGLFKCGKCKSRRVHHYQMQTRSADESMTTYCTCTECKNVWKF